MSLSLVDRRVIDDQLVTDFYGLAPTDDSQDVFDLGLVELVPPSALACYGNPDDQPFYEAIDDITSSNPIYG